MRIKGRGISGAALLLAIAAATTIGSRVVHAQAEHVRWDIVIVTPPRVEAGGTATASAQDGSSIAMTGAGTFVAPGGGPGSNSSTTGGGGWTTFNSAGMPTGSGTYVVTGLVRWDREPGTALPPFVTEDTIGGGEPSSGLVTLRIAYSDGSMGILVVSCNLPPPNTQMFEGITATKGIVDYWNHLTGLTLFHVR